MDLDGLKDVNDTQGHAAGDALLRHVTDAIRSRLRSYDPIVRVGGDEFVCALTDTDVEQARKRFHEVRDELTDAHGSASISVGLADLRPTDTLHALMARGDKALLDSRAGG